MEFVDQSSEVNSVESIPIPVDRKPGRPKGTLKPPKRPLSPESPVVYQTVTEGRTARRRTQTTRFDHDFLHNEEKKLLQQALKISKLETKRVCVDPPLAPIFYPTIEEFHDTLAYINKIRPQAEPFGICKIVPPPEWKPPCQINMNHSFKFKTKKQPINRLQEGDGFDDGNYYTIAEYKQMADSFYSAWCAQHHEGDEKVSQEQLAKDYWEMVETNNRQATVEYGSDLDTTRYMSGFLKPYQCYQSTAPSSVNQTTTSATDAGPSIPSDSVVQLPISNVDQSVKVEEINDSNAATSSPSTESANKLSREYYLKSNWNLNNIASAQGSVLKYLQTPVNGINVPWLYIGMLFATFCWHNEDNYCYSISYNHFGAPKQWYGVCGEKAPKMEEVIKEFLMGSFRERPDLLHYLTTQVPISLLMSNGVPICKAVQDPGTFMVTFPKAYHCGFSYGFNCGEAVNFSSYDWLPYGVESVLRYRKYARESVFSFVRLLFTIWHNKKDLTGQTSDLYYLCKEITHAIEWELYFRDNASEQGIRNLTATFEMNPNDFTIINKHNTQYDDARCCNVCKQCCIFSCVVCKCSQVKVSCVTDYQISCKCPVADKCLLVWNSNDFLKSVHGEAKAMLASYAANKTT